MKTLSKLIFILCLCTSTVGSIAQTSWTPSSDNTKMFISPLTTNVGIGTDNPSSKLEVNTNIWQSPFNVKINDASKLFVGPSGNVGIGTSDPAVKLQVNGDILIPEGRIALGSMYNGNGLNISYAQQYEQAIIDYEKNLIIRAGNTSANTISDVMVLKQNGSIGIGGWPWEQYKLNVKGSTYLEIPTSSSTINALNIDVASFETTENAANSSFLKLTDVAQSKTAFIVKGNGNVGIGTETPSSKLNIAINQSANESPLLIESVGGYRLFSVNTIGSVNIPTGSSYTSGNSTSTNFIRFGNIGSAGEIRYTGCDLNFHNGTKVTAIFKADGSFRFDNTIYAKEIIVQTNVWADDVFSKDYKLRSINEVEEFIKTNNHLPDVPSENNVKENGINVSEMNAIMLKKIEETMLYVIELKKENEVLRQQVESLMK